MGQRSGIGVVELAILEALESLGGRAGRPHVKCVKVVAAVDDRIGLAPGYAYEVLLDLARPWTVPIRLLGFNGNYGSRDYPAANARYVESRLSQAGEVALAAERGQLAPVPIGLINGNAHAQGSRPPFNPHRMIEAMRHVLGHPDVSDEELIHLIGPPDFLTGCTVTGDFTALAAGQPTTLRLHARLTVDNDRGQVVIENVPPNVGPEQLCSIITERRGEHAWSDDYPDLEEAARLPLVGVEDLGYDTQERLVCTPEPGTLPEALRDQLVDVYGITTTVRVTLPQPLAATVRSWVNDHRNEDLVDSLAALETAIDSQPSSNLGTH